MKKLTDLLDEVEQTLRSESDLLVDRVDENVLNVRRNESGRFIDLTFNEARIGISDVVTYLPKEGVTPIVQFIKFAAADVERTDYYKGSHLYKQHFSKATKAGEKVLIGTASNWLFNYFRTDHVEVHLEERLISEELASSLLKKIDQLP